MVFLVKLRHNLSFNVLSILFQMERNTLSYNFYQILDLLYLRYICSQFGMFQKSDNGFFWFFRTQSMVFWPAKDQLNRTLPEFFRHAYPNLRAIIHCCEVRTEKPGLLQTKNILFNSGKVGYILKYFLGKYCKLLRNLMYCL